MGKATQDGGDDRLRFVRHEEEGESQRKKKKYYISNDTSSRLFGLLKMRRFMIAMDSIESEESERERERGEDRE